MSAPTKHPVCKKAFMNGLTPKNFVCKAPARPQQKKETGTHCLPMMHSMGISTNAIKKPNLAQCNALRFRNLLYPWKCCLSCDLVERSVSTCIYELNSNELINKAITMPMPAETPVIITIFMALRRCDYWIMLSVKLVFSSNYSSRNAC